MAPGGRGRAGKPFMAFHGMWKHIWIVRLGKFSKPTRGGGKKFSKNVRFVAAMKRGCTNSQPNSSPHWVSHNAHVGHNAYFLHTDLYRCGWQPCRHVERQSFSFFSSAIDLTPPRIHAISHPPTPRKKSRHPKKNHPKKNLPRLPPMVKHVKNVAPPPRQGKKPPSHASKAALLPPVTSPPPSLHPNRKTIAIPPPIQITQLNRVLRHQQLLPTLLLQPTQRQQRAVISVNWAGGREKLCKHNRQKRDIRSYMRRARRTKQKQIWQGSVLWRRGGSRKQQGRRQRKKRGKRLRRGDWTRWTR